MYALGYYTTASGSHHYYVVVITQQAPQASATNLANSLAVASANEITATLLLHKAKDLHTKQSDQLYFFDNLLRHAPRLCLDKAAPPYILANTIPPRDFANAQTYELKSLTVAQFNIQAAKESPQLEVELCKIALLNTACVHIALSIIRIQWGYTPNEFGLNYLLQLCAQCTTTPFPCHSREGGNPLPSAFKPKTPPEIKRYKMLCTPPSLLNHRTRLHAAESDFFSLLDTCEQFLACSEELVSKHLELIPNPSSLIPNP
jgi:hypothetical protein